MKKAVIESGNKQYIVTEGMELDVVEEFNLIK
jgi:ribosomal protein L21